jgi:hypothetical protein
VVRAAVKDINSTEPDVFSSSITEDVDISDANYVTCANCASAINKADMT